MTNSINMVVECDQLFVEDSRFYISGEAFILGFNFANYGDFKKTLHLSSPLDDLIFPLGSKTNKELSHKYFNGQFVDYSKGSFSTPKDNGIDTNQIPWGDWLVSVSIEGTKNLVSGRKHFKYNKPTSFFDTGKSFLLVKSVNNLLCLSKRNYISTYGPCNINLNKYNFDIESGKLSLHGSFIVRGQKVNAWGQLRPYIIIRNKKSFEVVSVSEIGQASIQGSGFYNSEYGEYSKSGFSTFKNIPINLSNLLGEYDILITCFINGFDYSSIIGEYSSEKKCFKPLV